MTILSSILDRLKNNDPTLTVLDLSYDSSFSFSQIGVPLNERPQPLSNEDMDLLADALQQNTHLISLNLSNNGNGISKILKALENNTTLKFLILRGKAGAKSINLLKSIRKTNIIWVDTGQFNDLNFKNMKEIHLNSPDLDVITDRSIRVYVGRGLYSAISYSPFFSLSSLVDEILLDQKVSNLELEGLDYMHENNTQQIARLLKNHQTLQALGLCSGRVGDKGLETLISVLKNNNKLCRLDLGYNELQDKSIYNLIELFKVNKTITALNLSGNKASDAAFAQFILSLIDTNIKEIHFNQCNTLGKQSGAAFANFLEANNTCEKLILTSTYLPHDEVNLIFKALVNNKTLLHLDLSRCFNEENVPTLIEMLKTNKTLKKLDLSHGCFGDKGINMLANVLKENITLEAIDIRGAHVDKNYETKINFKLLRNALISNTSLLSIKILGEYGQNKDAKETEGFAIRNRAETHLPKLIKQAEDLVKNAKENNKDACIQKSLSIYNQLFLLVEELQGQGYPKCELLLDKIYLSLGKLYIDFNMLDDAWLNFRKATRLDNEAKQKLAEAFFVNAEEMTNKCFQSNNNNDNQPYKKYYQFILLMLKNIENMKSNSSLILNVFNSLCRGPKAKDTLNVERITGRSSVITLSTVRLAITLAIKKLEEMKKNNKPDKLQSSINLFNYIRKNNFYDTQVIDILCQNIYIREQLNLLVGTWEVAILEQMILMPDIFPLKPLKECQQNPSSLLFSLKSTEKRTECIFKRCNILEKELINEFDRQFGVPVESKLEEEYEGLLLCPGQNSFSA